MVNQKAMDTAAMTTKYVVAKLCIMPSFGPFMQKDTIKLIETDNIYKAELINLSGDKRSRSLLTVPTEKVQTMLDSLKNATIPAFPISPHVCDGELVELTIFGTNADVTLSWWSVGPEGAEEFVSFADWLRTIVTSKEQEYD